MPYRNSDGLWFYFAGDDREAHGGEFPGAGPTRYIEVLLDLADYAAGAATLNPGILILPRNSLIESVEYVVQEAAVGGTSIALGTVHLDGTAYDDDGLITAAAGVLANLTPVGHKVVFNQGTANAGAQVGTLLAYPADVVLTTVGTFTAGVIQVRVNLFVPGADLHPTQFNP